MRVWVRAGGGALEPLQVVRKIDGGKGVCNLGYAFFLSGYAFRDGQNLHVHTLSLNLHTVPNPKRVIKTELGTQIFLPPDMT